MLFRERDNGLPKAKVAARAAKEIYPGINVHFFDGNVVHDLGLGVYRWADVVFGGLDNREARLSINRNCWKLNRPWIDGAIEQIQGCTRVFVPDGPCYERGCVKRTTNMLDAALPAPLGHQLDRGPVIVVGRRTSPDNDSRAA